MSRWIRRAISGMLLLSAVLIGIWIGIQIAPSRTESVSAMQEAAPVDPVAAFRAERLETRQMQITQLNEIIHSANAGDEIVSMAQARLMDLMRWSELETALEGALSMRKFGDVVVSVDGDSANVFLRCDLVTQQQTSVILDIVCRETGFSGGNVKIIPIN